MRLPGVTPVIALVFSAVGAACLLSAAQAAVGVSAVGPLSTPAYAFPVADGAVDAQAVYGSTLYIGGTFTHVGSRTGSFVSFATPSGMPAHLPEADGAVDAIVADGAGGWYLGGTFKTVGGIARPGLAHITAAGLVDPDFKPRLTVGAGNPAVSALALSSDRKTLYVGGFFTSAGGPGGSGLAALSTATGKPISAFQAVAENVMSLALSPDGKTLYVGGGFQALDHAARHGVGAVNTSNGSLLTTFNPNADDEVDAIALSSDGHTLFVGGHFTSIGGKTRQRIAALSTATGSAVASFNPGLDASGTAAALALSPDGQTLYVGGMFSTLGGQSRSSLGAVSTATGAVTSFAPSAGGFVNALAISPDGKTLYAGNSSVSGYSTADGTPGFSAGANGQVHALAVSPDGSALGAGGSFSSFPVARHGLAAIDLATGDVTSFDAQSNGYAPRARGLAGRADPVCRRAVRLDRRRDAQLHRGPLDLRRHGDLVV